MTEASFFFQNEASVIYIFSYMEHLKKKASCREAFVNNNFVENIMVHDFYL